MITARLRGNRAATFRLWLIRFFMYDPRSTDQRPVDNGERLVALHHIDGGQSQEAAKLVSGDKHRTRRRCGTGGRLRKCRRQRGVEGHVALDLLGQLMNVPVQNGNRTETLEQ